MKVGDDDFLCFVADAGSETLSHLVAGFVGEGEAENVLGFDARLDQPARALGERARLSRSRPGEGENPSQLVRRDLFLLWI